MKYYVGADGGGTKTAYALFSESGSLLCLHEGPGSNHENSDFDTAARLIFDGFSTLLQKSGVNAGEIEKTLLGLAGLDHAFQYTEMQKRLETLGMRDFVLQNDGFLAVMAGSESGAAIGLNLGTGTVCSAVDRRGNRRQLAGLGEFSGDIGNGQWVAQQTVRLVYDDCVLGILKTELTKKLFSHFEIRALDELFSIERDVTKELVGLFFACEGDPQVRGLIEQMALRGAQLIAAQANTLAFGDTIEVVLSGSIHTKVRSEFYISRLQTHLKQLSEKDFSLVILEEPPVMGCIKWLLREYV